MVKVTVVIAVYNPGKNIYELLWSLDAQSLPQDEFEVVFVDDDSTDGSREGLQRWAAKRPNAKVLHNTPNSGWPGRPRNLGIDAAVGEYLFFADNDDKFTPNALEWMYDYAVANDADVVIAKEAGVGPDRAVPRRIFRRNIADAKLGKDPVLALLTPHKLVRTSMIREHGIRFPEGRVRLEDHYFMVRSYFAAKRISVLADRLCYYWMRRVAGGQNAAFNRVDPTVYYDSVGRALQVVVDNTDPGDFRDRLLSHWYDTKILARLRGDRFSRRSAKSQEDLVAALREVSDRFELGERLLPFLGAGARARALLLSHGTMDDLRALCTVDRVTSRVESRNVSWTADGRLALAVRSEFVYSDREPVTLTRDGERVFWDVRERAPELSLDPIDVTDLVPNVTLDILLVDREAGDLRHAPRRCMRVVDTDHIAAVAELLIDPREVYRETPADSIFDLHARLVGVGWASELRLPGPKTDPLPINGPAAAVTGRVSAYGTMTYGNVSLRLDLSHQNPVFGDEVVSG